MKKYWLLVAVMILGMILAGCVMFVPDSDSIGEAKTFTKDGISILLTDRFREQESERGFDAYYVSDFCGVMIEAESFDSKEGLADWTVADYLCDAIEKNGHTGIEPQEKDGLWYYVSDSGNTRLYVYAYKGSEAFWSVQFACMAANAELLEDTIYLFAQSVEIM